VNVVVYVSDALRVDHVGCYGARFVNTRTIDELAAGGARFDQAIAAAPWTAPSMTSMVTGLYPHRHGFLHWDAPLDPSARTIFAAFADAGYAVASFVFDRSYLFRNLPEANVLGETTTLDETVAWLRANASKPFFLFVHSWATHMPYDVRHAERKNWREAKREMLEAMRSDSAGALERLHEAYRAAVERASEELLASLLGELDELGVRERTAVAFLSDHGESWGERLTDKEELQGVYHMHGGTLYDEIVQVPLIVSAPGRLAPAVVRSQVRSIDLPATLLDLAGVDGHDFGDGASLLPLLRGSESGDRPALLSTTDRGRLSQLGIRVPPWKVIRNLDSGAEEAYRLDLDPRERVDRIADAPPALRTLLIDVELEAQDARTLSPDEEAVIVERLSNLGYI
jgi:arylsulfatase A-like enzyme